MAVERKKKKWTKPDYVITCIGGGSNAAGTFYHFLHEPSRHNRC
jgi:tryptophan synthase beta chain